MAQARQSCATPGLVLQVRRRAAAEATGTDEDPDPAAIGVGFTASRKVGGAVARNRARRRLKAVAREVLPGAGRPGHDYVLIARAGTRTRPYIELATDLRTALQRVSGTGKDHRRRRSGKGKGEARRA